MPFPGRRESAGSRQTAIPLHSFSANPTKIRKQTAINLEHILLGLLLEGSGVAAIALKNLGIRIERIRSEISNASAQP